MDKRYIGLFFIFLAQRTTSVHTNATVELAIFCDFDFGEHFQFNETKIREYWAIRMYDANLRFKTLPSLDISFVVTSLTIIRSKSDQDFIETRRDSSGKVAIENILRAFPSWVNSNHKRVIPAYDVAMLALGTDTTGDYTSRAFVDAACSNIHGFAVVKFERDNWWNSCGYLEFGLSTVLGAWADSDYSAACHNPKFIKGRECSKNHFFFSNCTNDAIYNSVQYSSCLHRRDSEVPSIFDTNELNVQPPSIKEQCILMTNNSNIWVNATDESRCFSTICYSGAQTNLTVEKTVYPVDNSPCDYEKSCFRGRCLTNGFQIRNAVSQNCLHSSNVFRSDDNLHLINCPDVPTALDRFMIIERINNAVLLATPYTSIDATKNLDKCMSYRHSSNIVKFQTCNDSSQSSEIHWELVELQNKANGFLLRHKSSQLCLASSTNNTVRMVDCSSEDRNLLWGFADKTKPPSNVFRKNWSTVRPTEISLLATTFQHLSKGNIGTGIEFAKESQQTKDFSCHCSWWIYFCCCALGFTTFILSLTVFELRKRNKQILLGQLLTQDFHELSKVIASDNVPITRDLI